MLKYLFGEAELTENSAPADMLTFELKNSEYWCDVVNSDAYGRFRQLFIENIGFPITTAESFNELVKICKNNRVLDIGCGTGFLASKLQDCGIEIDAVDNLQHIYFSAGWRPSPIVNQSDVSKVDFSLYDIVIMSWPDYESNFAYEVSRAMSSGKTLIFQGEWVGGCTANKRFYHNLQHNFFKRNLESSLLNAGHVTWQHIHDKWYVFTKL